MFVCEHLIYGPRVSNFHTHTDTHCIICAKVQRLKLFGSGLSLLFDTTFSNEICIDLRVVVVVAATVAAAVELDTSYTGECRTQFGTNCRSAYACAYASGWSRWWRMLFEFSSLTLNDWIICNLCNVYGCFKD